MFRIIVIVGLSVIASCQMCQMEFDRCLKNKINSSNIVKKFPVSMRMKLNECYANASCKSPAPPSVFCSVNSEHEPIVITPEMKNISECIFTKVFNCVNSNETFNESDYHPTDILWNKTSDSKRESECKLNDKYIFKTCGPTGNFDKLKKCIDGLKTEGETSKKTFCDNEKQCFTNLSSNCQHELTTMKMKLCSCVRFHGETIIKECVSSKFLSVSDKFQRMAVDIGGMQRHQINQYAMIMRQVCQDSCL